MTSTTLFTLYADPPADKPALVLGNSLGAGIGMWAAQLPVWKEHFRIIRFDYPGHNGTRNAPGAASTAEAWAEGLLQQLDQMGVEEFLYAGVSLGGMLGLRLATLAPARVRRLVFANARYWQTQAGQGQWNARIEQVNQGREQAMAQIASDTITRWLSADFRARQPTVAASLQRTLAETAPEGYVAGATVVRDYDARDALGLLQCPVLLMAGADDLAAPADHVRELGQQLAAQVSVIADSAHLSNVDSAQEFNRSVTKFLLSEPA